MRRQATSRSMAHYISPISPLYLPYISPISHQPVDGVRRLDDHARAVLVADELPQVIQRTHEHLEVEPAHLGLARDLVRVRVRIRVGVGLGLGYAHLGLARDLGDHVEQRRIYISPLYLAYISPISPRDLGDHVEQRRRPVLLDELGHVQLPHLERAIERAHGRRIYWGQGEG